MSKKSQYYCKHCEYTSDKQSVFNKHLLTKKHTNNSQKNSQISENLKISEIPEIPKIQEIPEIQQPIETQKNQIRDLLIETIKKQEIIIAQNNIILNLKNTNLPENTQLFLIDMRKIIIEIRRLEALLIDQNQEWIDTISAMPKNVEVDEQNPTVITLVSLIIEIKKNEKKLAEHKDIWQTITDTNEYLLQLVKF